MLDDTGRQHANKRPMKLLYTSKPVNAKVRPYMHQNPAKTIIHSIKKVLTRSKKTQHQDPKLLKWMQQLSKSVQNTHTYIQWVSQNHEKVTHSHTETH